MIRSEAKLHQQEAKLEITKANKWKYKAEVKVEIKWKIVKKFWKGARNAKKKCKRVVNVKKNYKMTEHKDKLKINKPKVPVYLCNTDTAKVAFVTNPSPVCFGYRPDFVSFLVFQL